MLKERSTVHKLNQECYGVILSDLLDGPATCQEMADVSGLTIITVQSLARVMVKHKVFHIVAWNPDPRGVRSIPVFALGRGTNKRRPRFTPEELRQRKKDRKAAIQAVNLITQTRGETHV